MSAATILLLSCFVFGMADARASTSGLCNEEEVSEAEYAFRNCEDSTKATVLQKQGKNGVDICDLLNNYFVGCEDQLDQLTRCKGKDHVSYIKRLSITSFAQVLNSISKGGTKATDCSILNPTTTTTTTTTASTGLYQPRTSGTAAAAFTSLPTLLLAATLSWVL